MSYFKKIILCLLVPILCLTGLSSCFSPKSPEHYVAFYLESAQSAGIFEAQRTFVLPMLDKEVRTGRDPVLNMDALSDCVVSEKVDPVLNRSDYGLFFRIKDDYAIRLRQISAAAAGRKLILVADGKPLGFCSLSRNFTRNDLFFYVMTSASGEEAKDQLDDLCFELNGFILTFREFKEQQ